MEISTNLIQKYIPQNNTTVQGIKQNYKTINTDNNKLSLLPAQGVNGISQINSNLPVSYSKIGEMSVPGIKEKASIFKLANGQKIVILPKKGPTLICTTYNVGSLNEKDEQRGISHFIEHNLFNGSKDIAPKEYDKRISDMGGYTNASTSFNYTDYYLSMQLLDDKSLEEGIKLNANLTQYPLFTQDQLDKEKEPVKSEIDMCMDSPSDIAYSNVIKNLFNIKSSSENFIIGTKENINALNREKVLDYFNTWYTPDNAVTVITGDVDVNETINLAAKYYNKNNDYSKINQRQYEKLEYLNKPVREDIISKNSLSAIINMGFAVPEGTSNKELENINMLINLLLSDTSRLSKALDKYGTKPDIGLEKIQNKPDSARALTFTLEPNEDQIEDVLKILYEEITYIANNPPSFEELENRKQRTLKQLNEVAETSEGINSFLTKIMLEGGNVNYFQEKINNISSITPQDISNAARKFLDLNKAAICVSHSKNATPEQINNNYKNTKSSQVSFGSKHSPLDTISEETAKIEQYKLPNNILTTIIPGYSNSQSSVSINFVNENLNDVSDPAFIILSKLLNRGSEFKDSNTMKEICEKNDFYHSIIANNSGLSFSVRLYPEQMQEGLSLLKEVITHPNFSQEEFDRAKRILKNMISDEHPSSYDKVSKDLLGTIKKYSSNKEERLKELEELTLDDIKNLYSRIIAGSKVNATMVAPTEENPQLKNILHNELSKDLPVFKEYTTDHDSQYYIYKPNTEAKIYTEAVENAQAKISQIYSFKELENVDDIAKVDLLNEILGGGMSSRLFTDLRENEKLAYHVSSSFEKVNDSSSISLNIETTTDSPDPNEGSPENINKALEGFKRNVDLLKTQNVTDEELKRAKASLKTSILNGLETNLDKKYMFSTVDTKYGINYKKAMLESIDKVTADDIKAAANFIFKNPPITAIDASQKTLDSLNL